MIAYKWNAENIYVLIILLLLIIVLFFVSGVITRMFTATSVHICPTYEKLLTATRAHISICVEYY